MPERLIIIGGDAAGMSAASQARRQRKVADLEIIAFERSSFVSYSACGEPYYVGGYISDIGQLQPTGRVRSKLLFFSFAFRLRHL